ncbi:hypothetical protein FRB99_007058 [Tulasnella sp. 403]|nr:hypothetical protein FRB99_007058 [Tulasnella sp. 403]
MAPQATGPRTIAKALEALQTLRSRNVRDAQAVVEHAEFLFEKEVDLQKKMGDEYWAFLEQLCLAALDLGNAEIVNDCIARLDERFPESPRVLILQGMRREASGKLSEALEIYDALLRENDSNAGIWKRRIAVYRQLGETKRAVEALCAYLDTFYTDVEGWLELADLYGSQHEYGSALEALSHALVIAPQNPFYVLQFGETAATQGDWELALKMFLRCVEMNDDANGDSGTARRAWFGIKLSTGKLLAEGVDKEGPSKATLESLEVLATGRITGGKGGGLVSKWV